MNWFINLLKKALQLFTGKSKPSSSIVNKGSEVLSSNSTNPSDPKFNKPFPVITPTQVVKPPATTAKSLPVKDVDSEDTPKLVIKPTTTIAPAVHIDPKTTIHKEVIPPSTSISYSATNTSSAHKVLNSGIRVSEKPFKTSLTGPINESILGLRRQVNYEPTTKYKQSIPQYFPLVLMPEKNTVIKPPVNGKSSNKGMTEESFCRDFLLKYFTNQVFDSLTVFHGSTPYEPDLAFIDLITGKNIFIDIEIDEPYDGVNRLPTHYRTSSGTIDDSRNVGFTERGWIVIRFAEEQIITNPNGCVKYIGEVIRTLYPSFNSKSLELPNIIEKIPIWNETDARSFAKDHKREKYLSIIEFFQAASPRDYTIKDTPLGIEIERDLTSKRSGVPYKTITPNPTVVQTPPPPPLSKPTPPAANVVNKTTILPPPIVNKQPVEEPRVTTKTDKPSQPSPRPYAHE